MRGCGRDRLGTPNPRSLIHRSRGRRYGDKVEHAAPCESLRGPERVADGRVKLTGETSAEVLSSECDRTYTVKWSAVGAPLGAPQGGFDQIAAKDAGRGACIERSITAGARRVAVEDGRIRLHGI
jgi:hypothetical protein